MWVSRWRVVWIFCVRLELTPVAHNRKDHPYRYCMYDCGGAVNVTGGDKDGRKERNFVFDDVLNTFYLRLYCVGHIMVEDHSDSERGNRVPPLALVYRHTYFGTYMHASTHTHTHTHR